MENRLKTHNVSLSFAGCGFLGIYHCGVGACFAEYAPYFLENAKFAGASAGALIACSLLCKVSMSDAVDFTLMLARRSREFPLGGWEPDVHIENIARDAIDNVLPPDAHIRCTGRLFVSVTLINGWSINQPFSNRLISDFPTRNDLLDVLMCSAFVPLFSGYKIPSYKGRYMIDGGLTVNIPELDKDTITISPLSGEHNICPKDPDGYSTPLTFVGMSVSMSPVNLLRLGDAFYPPSPDILKNYCWQGYADGLRFLMDRNLIHCPVHSVLTHLSPLVVRSCDDCNHHRMHARNSTLPASILLQWTTEKKRRRDSLGQVVSITAHFWYKFLTVPIKMLRNFIHHLYTKSFFSPDEIYEALSMDFAKLVKAMCNPNIWWHQVLVRVIVFWGFLGMEGVTRILSTALDGGDTTIMTSSYAMKKCREAALLTARVVQTACIGMPSKAICAVCGVLMSEKPHEVHAKPTFRAVDVNNVAQKTVKKQPIVSVNKRRHEVSNGHAIGQREAISRTTELVVTPSFRQLPVSTESLSSNVSQRAVGDVNVSMNVTAHVDDISLPCDVQRESVTVSVELGPVKLGHTAESEVIGGTENRDCAEQFQAGVVQKFVRNCDDYKNTFSIHYVNTDNKPVTEILFEEALTDVVPFNASDDDDHGVHKKQEEEPGRSHLESAKLQQVVKEKIMKDHMRYEQLRNRQNHKDNEIYNLQMSSFYHELPPPSPVLSRASSITNINMVDSSDGVKTCGVICSGLETVSTSHGCNV